MNTIPPFPCRRPRVALLGEIAHAELAEAIAQLRSTAEVLPEDQVADAELIVLAQSRPGVIAARDVDGMRRDNPLASFVALLGTWCEGELRTGRPLADVRRIYWYDFPQWWLRQLAMWNAGRCPDWARPEEVAAAVTPIRAVGMVAIKTTCWDTAETLAGVLRDAGYLPCLLRHDEPPPPREFVAGIWEGRQLDEREAKQLAHYCEQLGSTGAAVVALLDFPRFDRCERARECGAAVVLGKPWQNADLLAALEHATQSVAAHKRSALAA
jgi:hypothetical protein